jgi:hypothetical protein
MKVLQFTLVLLLALYLALPAVSSDFDFGSTARSISLGGAGLALGDEFQSTSISNPAAPALHGKKFQFIFPGLDFKSSGASAGKVWDNLDKLSSGDSTDAISLANDFASKNTTLTFSSIGGFAGTSGLLVTAEVTGTLIPSDDVKRWASSGLKFNNDTTFNPNSYVSALGNANFTTAVNNWAQYAISGSSSDRTAAEAAFGTYLTDLSKTDITTSFIWGPTVQFSSKMPSVSGDLWIGTNISILNSESRRWTIVAQNPGFNYTGNSISLSSVDFATVEVPTKRKTSLKADIGMIYKPLDSAWQYGVVVNNFIKPNLRGVANSQGQPMLSVGVATKPVPGFVFAADLVNVTGSNGEDARLRAGAEYRAGRWITLRLGHSGDKITYGANILGIDLAFSEKSPSILSNAIKF